MNFASGDQNIHWLTKPARSSCRERPVSKECTQSPQLTPDPAVKATLRPSGDKANRLNCSSSGALTRKRSAGGTAGDGALNTQTAAPASSAPASAAAAN